MKIKIYKTFLFIGIYLYANFSFGQKQTQVKYDHLVLFVKTKKLQEELTESLFTLAEKAGTAHLNQGTKGRYFFFYNTYIELLYLSDSAKAIANQSNFGSNYIKRWETTANSCPFAFGLNLIPFDTSLTPLSFHKYKSKDAATDDFYLMSPYNTELNQPMIYVSTPKHAYEPYNSLDDVDLRFEDFMRVEQKSYLSHPSGIKRLTDIKVTLAENESISGNNEFLNNLEQVQIEKGLQHELILIFDEQAQGKEFSFEVDFPLIIKY